MTTAASEGATTPTVHLSAQPRKRQVAECGQPIDGLAHQQTMLIGSVDCEACKTIWLASKHRARFSMRPGKI